MARTIRVRGAALAASALSALALVALGTASAEAVVYCKAVGVPKGCVVRPAPVVVAHHRRRTAHHGSGARHRQPRRSGQPRRPALEQDELEWSRSSCSNSLF